MWEGWRRRRSAISVGHLVLHAIGRIGTGTHPKDLRSCGRRAPRGAERCGRAHRRTRPWRQRCGRAGRALRAARWSSRSDARRHGGVSAGIRRKEFIAPLDTKGKAVRRPQRAARVRPPIRPGRRMPRSRVSLILITRSSRCPQTRRLGGHDDRHGRRDHVSTIKDVPVRIPSRTGGHAAPAARPGRRLPHPATVAASGEETTGGGMNKRRLIGLWLFSARRFSSGSHGRGLG
jgi:hypothetical protein